MLLPTLLIAAPTTAAEAAGDSASVNPLRPGAVAVEFGVNPVFNYGAGAALSGKWHTGRSTAIRLGGTVQFQETKGNGTEFESDGLQTINLTTDTHDEFRSYSAFAQLVQYLWIRDRMSLFVAPGPVYRWNSDHAIDHDLGSDGSATALRFDSSGWAVGLDVAIGFEWFFQHRLSLGARYGIAGLYGESHFERNIAESDPSSSFNAARKESSHDKSFTITTDSTLLTLTAYF